MTYYPLIPTPPQPKHRNTSNTPPVSTGVGKSQTQSSHLLTPLPPIPLRAKHIHISHTPRTPLTLRTTLIPSTSAALDTIHHNHSSSIPYTSSSVTSHPYTISAYTHATQTTVHASQSPHINRVAREPRRLTKDDHTTTDSTQTQQ